MTAKWEPHAVRGLVATAVAEKEIDMVSGSACRGHSGSCCPARPTRLRIGTLLPSYYLFETNISFRIAGCHL